MQASTPYDLKALAVLLRQADSRQMRIECGCATNAGAGP
jgi:hypothetical protein